MTDGARTAGASVRLELAEPAPEQAPVGAALTLRVQASCGAGFDRHGLAVTSVPPGGQRATHPLGALEDGGNMADVVLHVPPRPGEHTWRVLLPEHEALGIRHGECALSVSIRAVPHQTSLAVWAVPPAAVAGARFAIKAGAKSSGDCSLAGAGIEICDASGAVVASGCLGDRPWPGTEALHWTELELTAPLREGLLELSARFAAADVELPHDGASTPFHVAVMRPPEHKLTVKVIARETATPIGEADIRVGLQRATTDAAGLAEVGMGKGRYELQVWKAGYEAPPTTVEIGDDAFVQVEVATLPEEDPDARWKM